MKDSRRAFPRVSFALLCATLIGISQAAYLPLSHYRKCDIQARSRACTFNVNSSVDENQNSIGDEDGDFLRDLLKQQHKQINLLMDLLQNQNQHQNPAAREESTTAVVAHQPLSNPLGLTPCKVMLFIDGTWLYYSLHDRGEEYCPLIKKYGKGWQQRYKIDWEVLPRILCEKLKDPGWRVTPGDGANQRSLEVVRASVFTSYKADTSPLSLRYQMFQEMKAANYDVHMMQTVGKVEKCVDIQLAVEMLHYATVPQAYDIALILTGDKDFMPAMIRTRQKGRKVGLVSMRRNCNRALFETAGLKDFDVCWIEDFLDEWIKPRGDLHSVQSSLYSTPFFIRIIADFVQHPTLPQVSSRDLGRYLKDLQLPGGDAQSSVLNELKTLYGGLSQFLWSQESIFIVHQRNQDTFKTDSSDNAFFVSLRTDTVSNDQFSQQQSWSDPEQEFFLRYTTDRLNDELYAHSLLAHNGSSRLIETQSHEKIPEHLTRDYSALSKIDLIALCRDRQLPVSGVKAALLERINKDNEEQIAQLLKERRSWRAPSAELNPETMKHLLDLIFEYIKASGGIATSRDVGRYLAANRGSAYALAHSSAGASNKRVTALQELKDSYGTLFEFIGQQSDLFVTKPSTSDSRSFFIELKRR